MEFDVKVWQKELEKLGNNLPSVVFLLAFLSPPSPYNLCKFCLSVLQGYWTRGSIATNMCKVYRQSQRWGGEGGAWGALPK